MLARGWEGSSWVHTHGLSSPAFFSYDDRRWRSLMAKTTTGAESTWWGDLDGTLRWLVQLPKKALKASCRCCSSVPQFFDEDLETWWNVCQSSPNSPEILPRTQITNPYPWGSIQAKTRAFHPILFLKPSAFYPLLYLFPKPISTKSRLFLSIKHQI